MPQWDAYLRLALRANQSPAGPRYRDTYLRCWSRSGWAAAASGGNGSLSFTAGTVRLGFYDPGSPWVNVTDETCVNAAKAARGELSATTVIALASVLHETFDRQGISDANVTCLGAVGLWQAVDLRAGAGQANHALSELLAWYEDHLGSSARAGLAGCGARIGAPWNG